MDAMLLAAYLILGGAIAYVEGRRMIAGKPIDALSFFNVAYFLFFVFVPIHVIVFGEAVVRQKYAYETWSHGNAWTALSLMLAYAVFVFAYFRHGRKYQTRRAVKGYEALAPIAARIAWVFFFIGIMALAYHVSLVGGLREAVLHAPAVRTGEFRLKGLLFIRQFSIFLATAFMLYWAAFLDGQLRGQVGMNSRPRRFFQYLGLALLGGGFVYYALSTYGRREFLYPLFICLVIWALAGRRRSWSGLFLLAILSTLWFWAYSFAIPEAAPRSVDQETGPADFLRGVYFRTLQGAGDTFMHYVAAEHAKLWQFGFLADLREIPYEMLPSQLLGFERSRGMLGETSAYILGRPLEPGLTGEEPLGLHGYLLVNFSYAGMFLFFYLAGMGYRRLDSAMRPERGSAAISWLLFLWVIIGLLDFLREGVLVFLIKPHISWWLALGVLLIYAHKRHIWRDAAANKKGS